MDVEVAPSCLRACQVQEVDVQIDEQVGTVREGKEARDGGQEANKVVGG